MRRVGAPSLAVFSLFIVGTCYIAYGLARQESMLLVPAYAGLFFLYSWAVWREDDTRFWLTGSILIRLCLLGALPNLSDDFYRFIWDGRSWAAGIHPFAAMPAEVVTQNIPGLDQALFEKLNSKQYFTVYPPLAQFVFWISVKMFPNSVPGSVAVMRMLIILAETGTILLMIKLLERWKLPRNNALLYALNPLVILELTGNLHFEAFMIFFLLLSLWFLNANRIMLGAVGFSFAIGTRLLPVIFLPFLPALIGWRKSFVFYVLAGGTCLLLFIPMYDPEVFDGFSKSLGMYFQKFEFNASLYYLVREYGFWKVGYNTIQSSGWKLGVISGVLIVAYSFLFLPSRSMPKDSDHGVHVWRVAGWLFILFIYLVFATTVHPWYITTLLAISVFTPFRFVMTWTASIFLTYIGYSAAGFSENLWITALEYVSVFGYLGYELSEKERSLRSQ